MVVENINKTKFICFADEDSDTDLFMSWGIAIFIILNFRHPNDDGRKS